MLETGMTAREIAQKLKRTPTAVYARMHLLRKKTSAPQPCA
jgi:DNA-directed RNA polymerase specialized sigma24 family protein